MPYDRSRRTRNGHVGIETISRNASFRIVFESTRILHADTVRGVAFSPDSKTLASGSYDETVQFWDIEDDSTSAEPLRHPYSVFDIAYSPDGRLLATASSAFWLFDPEPHRLAVTDIASSVAFSPDGRLLAGTSMSGHVWLFDPTTRQLLRRLDGFGSVFSVAFSPDGLLGIGGSDNNIRIRSGGGPDPFQTVSV